MIISIQQPEHWPWLGFFDKVQQVDTVVLFDTVQFKPRYFETRVRIRTFQVPRWQWLRVPILGARHRQLIKDVKIDNNQPWQEEALKAIEMNYKKAPFWRKYYKNIKEIYNRKWECLVDFDTTSIKWISQQLGLKVKYILASTLDVNGKADDLLVDICKKLSALEYLSGKFGKDYIDSRKFKKAGVKLKFQEFEHPRYSQFHPGNFQTGMSALDLLFNHGNKAKEVLANKFHVA